MFSSFSSFTALIGHGIFAVARSDIAGIPPSALALLMLLLLGWVAFCLYFVRLLRKRPPPQAAWRKAGSARQSSPSTSEPGEESRPRGLPSRRPSGRPGFRMGAHADPTTREE